MNRYARTLNSFVRFGTPQNEKIQQSYSAFVPHNLNIFIIAIFKRFVKQKMIKIKLVGVSMTFYCTKHHLSKCNGS
jgi:hypothetical protein